MPALERKDLGALSGAIRDAEKRGLAREKADGLEALIGHLVSTAEIMRDRFPETERIQLRLKSHESSELPEGFAEELVNAMEPFGVALVVEHSGVLSPREAADTLGVSKQAVINWIKAGKIRAERTPGGHFRISVEDFSSFREKYEAFRNYRPKRTDLAEMSDEELVEDLKERRRKRKSRPSELS